MPSGATQPSLEDVKLLIADKGVFDYIYIIVTGNGLYICISLEKASKLFCGQKLTDVL